MNDLVDHNEFENLDEDQIIQEDEGGRVILAIKLPNLNKCKREPI